MSRVDFGSEVIVKTDSLLKQWPACRICRSDRIRNIANIEFYRGYNWPIYDCGDCGCRFTSHDASTYDFLYSERSSCYGRYTIQADSCKLLFDRGDLVGLRAELSQASKYRFIIDEIERLPPHARVVEFGSSRGHLTSYFILAGRRIMGIDVSPTAVAAAVAAFGKYFVLPGDPSVEAQAPYDVVFHVGTIGCVSDPVGITTRCLNLLKPGGRLLFNAPNREALNLRNQLWFESAPPPDVVTLFAPGFWRNHFSDVAVVSEQIEPCGPEQNFRLWLRRLGRRRWRKPLPMPLKDSETMPKATPKLGDRSWRVAERILGKVARLTELNRFVPIHPTEYGLFVSMLKK